MSRDLAVTKLSAHCKHAVHGQIRPLDTATKAAVCSVCTMNAVSIHTAGFRTKNRYINICMYHICQFIMALSSSVLLFLYVSLHGMYVIY